MFIVIKGLHEQVTHQKLPLHHCDGVIGHRADRRMLMAILAGEGRGGIDVDHPPLMLNVTGETTNIVERSDLQLPAGIRPLLSSVTSDAGVLVVIDVAVTIDACLVGRSVPRTMTRRTRPFELRVRLDQLPRLIAGARHHEERRNDRQHNANRGYPEPSVHQIPAK